MKNNIVDLRNHLFETLEALKDPEKPMDIDRAKAIVEVSKAITETAKVEVDFLRVAGGTGSGFIPEEKPALEGPVQTPRLVKG